MKFLGFIAGFTTFINFFEASINRFGHIIIYMNWQLPKPSVCFQQKQDPKALTGTSCDQLWSLVLQPEIFQDLCKGYQRVPTKSSRS